MYNDLFLICYKVKTVCTNCGDGQEYQVPKGVKLHIIKCANCGIKTLRLATPDEAKNIPSLTFIKYKFTCANCKRVCYQDLASYENVEDSLVIFNTMPCGECGQRGKIRAVLA